jgi:hypothetical protein
MYPPLSAASARSFHGFSRGTFSRIRNRHGLFDRLACLDLSTYVRTEGFFACRFFEWHDYFAFFMGLAVLADSLNALAVGAPLVPGLRIFSPDPAAMRAFFA